MKNQNSYQLEWQSEIRRGYFAEGLSGVQYARPEAADMLENFSADQSSDLTRVLISVTDPALPFGGSVDWNLTDANGNRIPISRFPGNHLLLMNDQPILYLENYGTCLWRSEYFSGEMIETAAQSLKTWLIQPKSIRPRRRIEISLFDGKNAATNQFAAEFI